MCFKFVDNTDLIEIVKENINIYSVKNKQHQGTLCWGKKLRIKGGALKPSIVFNRFTMEELRMELQIHS